MARPPGICEPLALLWVSRELRGKGCLEKVAQSPGGPLREWGGHARDPSLGHWSPCSKPTSQIPA